MKRPHRRRPRALPDDFENYTIPDPIALALAVGRGLTEGGNDMSDGEREVGAALLGSLLLEKYRLFYTPCEVYQACIQLVSEQGHDEFFELLEGAIE